MEEVDHSEIVSHNGTKMRSRLLRVSPAISIGTKTVVYASAASVCLHCE